MKRIFIPVLLCALLFSCKKQNSGAPEKTILLSHVMSNGHTADRFFYSPDNKLIRYESYKSQPANVISYYAIIEYGQSGAISQLTTYQEPGAVPKSRTIVESAEDGKIKSALNYDLQSATPNVPVSTSAWTYNVKGQLTKLVAKDKNDELLYYINYSYYPDGSIKQSDQYSEESNQLYLVEKHIYSIPGTYFPKGLETLRTVLGIDYLAYFFSETIQVFDYDQNGFVTFNRQYQMAAREYSADSTLLKQTVTIKKIKPAGDDDIVYKQYEYIEQ
jgi:hypothetical protein